jgi:hypothetical protein
MFGPSDPFCNFNDPSTAILGIQLYYSDRKKTEVHISMRVAANYVYIKRKYM